MALDMTNSPYLQPLPRSNLDGSRRLAKRLDPKNKELLQKMWSQVFVSKRSSATTAEHTQQRAKLRQERQREKDRRNEEEGERQRAKREEEERERQRVRKEEEERDRQRTRKDEEERDRERVRERQREEKDSSSDENSNDTSVNKSDENSGKSNEISVTDERPERTSEKCDGTEKSPSPQVGSFPQHTTSPTRDIGVKLPPIKTEPKGRVTFAAPESRRIEKSDTHSNPRRSARKESVLVAELANSPYLNGLKDRTSLKLLIMEKQKEVMRTREQRPPHPPSDPTPYRASLRRSLPDYSSTTNVVDSWRAPRLPRGTSFSELEDRAKKLAQKAAKVCIM